MNRVTQIELVGRTFDYLDARSTAMMDRVHLEPVSGYDDAEQARLEHRCLFLGQPLVLAMSCELARPGDFLTHDATGVPIALVRAHGAGARVPERLPASGREGDPGRGLRA